MKQGWQTKKLGDVCATLLSAKAPQGHAPYVEIGDVNVDTKQIISKEKGAVKGSILAPAGSVLVSRVRPTRGAIAILEENSAVSSAFTILKPRDILDLRLLFYGLAYSDKFSEYLGKKQTGLLYPSVKEDEILAYGLSFPTSLEEQGRIVGILEEAFAGIAIAEANAKANLQNARALFASRLQTILLSKHWKQQALSDVCERVEYGTSAKSNKAGKVVVLRMGNIQDGRIDWGNLAYTDDQADIDKYLLKHDDVLFNRTNSPELVGKSAIYKGDRPAIFAGYLIRIHRKTDLLDAEYLNYFLGSDMALNYGKTVAISSVNQANINGTKLMGYPIPVPPMSEQRAIVKELNALGTEIEMLSSVCNRKLTALGDLKESLLHEAFSGRL